MPKKDITPTRNKSVSPFERANEVQHESLLTYQQLKSGQLSVETAKAAAQHLRNAERVIESEIAMRRVEIQKRREDRLDMIFHAKYRPSASINGVLPAANAAKTAEREKSSSTTKPPAEEANNE